MKRAIIEDDEKALALRIRNRLAARRSIDRRNKEVEILREENQYLRNVNKLLEERLDQLEKLICERHSSPSTLA